MRRIQSAFMRLIRDEAGQDLIEYALLAAFLAIAAIAALIILGPIVNQVFNNVATQVGGAGGGS
jgi:Flp pilus assembly pilin Flp